MKIEATRTSSDGQQVIATSDVEVGMFVAALDRPWLGTPFLIQGFLIADDNDIAALRRYCRSVVIDRTRSVGAHYAAPAAAERARHRRHGAASVRTTLPASSEQSAEDDFFSLLQSFRDRQPSVRHGPVPPPVQPNEGRTRLTEEILYSAAIVDDVQRTLNSVRDSIQGGQSTDLEAVRSLVADMAKSVERNPDALVWLTRLKATDDYSYDHALDVSVHLMVLARFLGMPEAEVEQLGYIGLMQDVGKAAVPEEILKKPGPLSAEEYALLQSHVASSVQFLSGKAGFDPPALLIVASHHERYNGTGYPRRLAGDRIPFKAELAGLIDTYCAMTRKRAHNRALANQKALEQLIAVRGITFREVLVDQLIQCIGLYPVGTLVELSTGEVAVVIQQNQVRRLKPRVLVVLGPDKSVERYPRTLNLMLNPKTPTGDEYWISQSLPSNAYGVNPEEFFIF